MSADGLDLDEIEQGPTERIPGDFLRVKGSGAPRVLRIDGSGKYDTFGRPSNLYSGNRVALDRWKEQQLLIGLQLMIDRGEPIDGAPDVVIRRALELAGASLAAERGTAIHAELDAIHNVRDVERAERDVIAELDRLGFSPDFVEGCRLAYARTLDRLELEVLTTEAKCVNDPWRVAGSTDAFMRAHRTLIFDDGGVITADSVVTEDHKTGQCRMVAGRPAHWLHYAAQIAAYAGSVHYVIDGDDEHREPWPWEINQTNGLILHFDLLGALDTDVLTVTPIRVDLHRGRQLGEHAVIGRELDRATHAFGMAKDPPIAVTIETAGPSRLEVQLEASLVALGVDVASVAAPTLVLVPDERTEANGGHPVAEGELVVDYVELRAWLQGRIDVAGRHTAASRADLGRSWPTGVAPLKASSEHTDDELAAIEAALDDVEKRHSIPFGPTRPGASKGGDGWLNRLLTTFPGSTIHSKDTAP